MLPLKWREGKNFKMVTPSPNQGKKQKLGRTQLPPQMRGETSWVCPRGIRLQHTSRRQHITLPQPNNPLSQLMGQKERISIHHKVWRKQLKQILHTRKRRKGKKVMVDCQSNSKIERTTITSAVEEATMTLWWRTSNPHHNKIVGDSRNRTPPSTKGIKQQTGDTTRQGETAVNLQSCKSSQWWASMSEASTVRRSNKSLEISSSKMSSTLSA